MFVSCRDSLGVEFSFRVVSNEKGQRIKDNSVVEVGMKASLLRCLGHFDYATSHRSITNARRSVLRLPGRRNS